MVTLKKGKQQALSSLLFNKGKLTFLLVPGTMDNRLFLNRPNTVPTTNCLPTAYQQLLTKDQLPITSHCFCKRLAEMGFWVPSCCANSDTRYSSIAHAKSFNALSSSVWGKH